MKMSLNSVSVWISPNNCSRSSSITSPGSLTRVRASARRPVSMVPSPVNCPARCVTISASVPADGRSTCISPLNTTKNGTGR